MSIELVPFEPAHLDKIVGGCSVLFGSTKELAEAANIAGLAFTGMEHGEIVGSAGVMPLWPGVAESWVAIPILPLGVLREVCRLIRTRLPQLMAEKGLHRIQASIPLALPQASKFARIVGFTDEGSMPGFGADKSDYQRFSMVRK